MIHKLKISLNMNLSLRNFQVIFNGRNLTKENKNIDKLIESFAQAEILDLKSDYD